MLETPTHNPYGIPSTDASLVQEGQVSSLAIDLLRRTRGWVLFLAILGYIGCGFMLIAALIMIVGMGALSSQVNSTMPFSFATLGAIYILFALLYLYPCIKLQKYAGAIKRLLQSHSAIDLETALDHQRGFWKFCGIIALIIVSLYVFIIAFAIIGGIASAAMAH